MTNTDTEVPKRTDGGAGRQPEGRSGDADLDAELSAFEKATAGTQKPNTESPLLKKLQPVIDFASNEMATKANERQKADIESAVKLVKDDAEISDTFVRGFLHARAADDAEFNAAWENRAKAPKVWDAMLSKAKEDFAKEASTLPMSKVKSDVAAAQASIRGGTTTPGGQDKPDPVKLKNLSDQEWNEYVEGEIAKNAR